MELGIGWMLQRKAKQNVCNCRQEKELTFHPCVENPSPDPVSDGVQMNVRTKQ